MNTSRGRSSLAELWSSFSTYGKMPTDKAWGRKEREWAHSRGARAALAVAGVAQDTVRCCRQPGGRGVGAQGPPLDLRISVPRDAVVRLQPAWSRGHGSSGEERLASCPGPLASPSHSLVCAQRQSRRPLTVILTFQTTTLLPCWSHFHICP